MVAAPSAAGARAKALLPQQAADASADVELTGMSILLEELTGFKRPAMSKGVGVKLVVRFVVLRAHLTRGKQMSFMGHYAPLPYVCFGGVGFASKALLKG